MDLVTRATDAPSLRHPVLITAFAGWNDAGEAATTALATLRRALEPAPLAELDAEEFFDFQVARPIVRLDKDGQRVIEWPSTRLWGVRLGQDADHDLVLAEGTEPNLRWRTFSRTLVDLAEELDVTRIVTLGALQVDEPHTRAVLITGSAGDEATAERMGLARSSYEGPTGIVGVLHAEAAQRGLETVTMWAGVPHYLSQTGYLPGALALVERVDALLGIDLHLTELAEQALKQREEIAEVLAEDEELAGYVSELEASRDAGGDAGGGGDFSPAELAAEVERYLREKGGT